MIVRKLAPNQARKQVDVEVGRADLDRVLQTVIHSIVNGLMVCASRSGRNWREPRTVMNERLAHSWIGTAPPIAEKIHCQRLGWRAQRQAVLSLTSYHRPKTHCHLPHRS